jgi:putative transposase
VTWMCQTLNVSRAGYYAWCHRPVSDAGQRREVLVAAIREIHAAVKGRYGSPRMAVALRDRGHACSENTVAKLMRDNDIHARRSRRFVPATTASRHGLPVAENVLDREFNPPGANQVWGTDITYIPTGQGWLYLAVVEDLFSRRIVGWSMDATMTSRLVVDALDMAVAGRRPEVGLLAHSDRGSQFASAHYQEKLARHGLTCSMSGVAQCWDNAPVESFFGTLKRELVHDETYTTHDEAKASIFEYIEVFYNRVRLHSSLGYVSPEAFERAHNPHHP